MKRSKTVILLITGSVVLTACGRTAPRPGYGSPTPTPTPGSGGSGGGHWWFSGSHGWGFGSSTGATSAGVSRGGFGGHAGGSGE